MDTRAPDDAAAEQLILAHLPDIVTLCNRMFRQRSDAEDATHEAVIAVLRALPSYERRGPVRHWVLKVALNAARQHRRTLSRKTRRESALPEHGLPGAEMPNAVDDREERESLRAAIAELPEELRETVTLYYFHNLTQTEIADCVGCSQKTVHVRVKKGLDLLSRRLVGSPELAAMIAAGGTGTAVLDAVSPALVSSVQQSIAAFHAATATSAATAAAATTIATGGIVMNAKLAAGAALLAVTCLVSGAVLSNAVFANDDETPADDVAALRVQVEDGRRDVQALEQNLESARRRNSARVAELDRELAALRIQVAEKDEELTALRERVVREPSSENARELSREERWEELKSVMAGVLAIIAKMDEGEGNQFELGPQMVAELGRLSVEDYDSLMAFDADETDPRIVETIRAVMLQALVFVPKTAKHRDDYMGRYLERVRRGGFGDSFDMGALRRVTFRMPPFVDAYAKIVAPMDEDLRRQYVDLAMDRVANGPTPSHRYDGIVFLGRSDDARATETLKEYFRQPANDAELRIAAAHALIEHADDDVLRMLRDAEGSEQSARVLAELKNVIPQVEQRVAKQR